MKYAMKYAWMVFALAVVGLMVARAEEPQALSLDARVGQLEAKLTMLEIRVKTLEHDGQATDTVQLPPAPMEAKTAVEKSGVIDLAQMLPFNAGAPAAAKGKNVFGVVRVDSIGADPQDPDQALVHAYYLSPVSGQKLTCVLEMSFAAARFEKYDFCRIRGRVQAAQIIQDANGDQVLVLRVGDVQAALTDDPRPNVSVGGTFHSGGRF